VTTTTDRVHDQLVFSRPPHRHDGAGDPDPLDLRPATAFEAITRQMVESLTEELREIKSRLNGLIFMMVGAILLEIVSRMLAA